MMWSSFYEDWVSPKEQLCLEDRAWDLYLRRSVVLGRQEPKVEEVVRCLARTEAFLEYKYVLSCLSKLPLEERLEYLPRGPGLIWWSLYHDHDFGIVDSHRWGLLLDRRSMMLEEWACTAAPKDVQELTHDEMFLEERWWGLLERVCGKSVARGKLPGAPSVSQYSNDSLHPAWRHSGGQWHPGGDLLPPPQRDHRDDAVVDVWEGEELLFPPDLWLEAATVEVSKDFQTAAIKDPCAEDSMECVPLTVYEMACSELLDCGPQQRPEKLNLMDFSWEQEDDQREPPMPASQPREEGKIAYTSLSQEMEDTGAALSGPAEHTGEEKSPLLLCFGSAVLKPQTELCQGSTPESVDPALQPVGEGVGAILEKELLSVKQESGQQGLTPGLPVLSPGEEEEEIQPLGQLTNPLETQILSWGLLNMSPVTEGVGWGEMPPDLPWGEREMPTAVPWGDVLCSFTSTPGHLRIVTVDFGVMGATLPHALRRTQDWRIVGSCLSSHTGPPWTARGIMQTGG